ncbi:MAG: hypothetical protein LBQ54_11885 [Planctomycetaceae bacterium]|jgi:hypothetical protein|nr:hypothetical protein [Planctomycetaceae bacterium]
MKRMIVCCAVLTAVAGLFSAGKPAFADFDAAQAVSEFNSMNNGRGLVFDHTSPEYPTYSPRTDLPPLLAAGEVWVQNRGTQFANTSAYGRSGGYGYRVNMAGVTRDDTWGGVNPAAPGSEYFSTFCVSPNRTTTRGVNATGTLNYSNGQTKTSDGNALTLGAAFLYKMYATEQINSVGQEIYGQGGFMWGEGGLAGRESDIIWLRAAVLYYLGIIDDVPSNASGYTYLLNQYAIRNLGLSDITEANAFWMQTYDPSAYYDFIGDYSIFVMNVTQNGATAQDLLYITPMTPLGGGSTPEPGILLLWTLGSCGLAGWGWKRKQKASLS